MLIGLGILLVCLSVRLTVAALACWKLTLKEKIFVCCAWIPKSIVEVKNILYATYSINNFDSVF